MEKDSLAEIQAALGRPDVVRTKMFGKDCLAARGKVMAVLFEGDVVFKLSGDDHESALGLEGAHLWDPRGTGHPMREWVQVPRQHPDRFARLAEAAYLYVTSARNE